MLDAIPLGRTGHPKDIAETVTFVSSDQVDLDHRRGVRGHRRIPGRTDPHAGRRPRRPDTHPRTPHHQKDSINCAVTGAGIAGSPGAYQVARWGHLVALFYHQDRGLPGSWRLALPTSPDGLPGAAGGRAPGRRTDPAGRPSRRPARRPRSGRNRDDGVPSYADVKGRDKSLTCGFRSGRRCVLVGGRADGRSLPPRTGEHPVGPSRSGDRGASSARKGSSSRCGLVSATVTQVSSSDGDSSPGPGVTMVSAAGTGLSHASHRPHRSTCPPSAACRNSRRGPPGAQKSSPQLVRDRTTGHRAAPLSVSSYST